MNECLESVKIIQQVFHYKSTIFSSIIDAFRVDYLTIEGMIHRYIFIFLFVMKLIYVRQEAPKGELGLFIVSDNLFYVYRVKIRSPDYYNFQMLNILSYCYKLADLISILGTIDFVLGSVDRL